MSGFAFAGRDGCVPKEHDSLSFSLSQHSKNEENWKWKMTYRILCKSAPGIPEVYMASGDCAAMQRSFMREHVFAVGPDGHEALAKNRSILLYDTYLAHKLEGDPKIVRMPFIEYARIAQLSEDKKKGTARNFAAGPRRGCTVAVGIRYKYELLDLYLGQFSASQFPHRKSSVFVSPNVADGWRLDYTKEYLGTCQYLRNLKYTSNEWYMGLPVVQCGDDDEEQYALCAFPGIRVWYLASEVQLEDHCLQQEARIGPFVPGGAVFTEDQLHAYLEYVHLRDMSMRSLGVSRKRSFLERLRALRTFTGFLRNLCFHLHYPLDPNDENWVEEKAATDRMLFLQLQADWNRVCDPKKLSEFKYVGKQLEFLEMVRAGRNRQDANAAVFQWMHLCGKPGTGKTQVLIQAAMDGVRDGLKVCILVPTGSLVHQYRAQLPEMDNLTVETFHAGMSIMRNNDRVVTYQPPSRFRRYDLFLCDEASQVTDDVWLKFYMSVQEMAHQPFVVLAGDFQQLQPVGGKSLLQRCVAVLPVVELERVYRSEDPLHLPFCHHLRDHQPSRARLDDYFSCRRFLRHRMADAVRYGLAVGEGIGHPFVWLCVTNKGAAEVNAAAIRIIIEEKGISEDQVQAFSFRGDPRIDGGGDACLFPKALLRFTRNMDKTRGVVNGAVGEVEHFLSPGVCTVRLVSSESRVVLHPLYDKKHGYFLPCVQGYATTIRRAQGMSLHCGCLYFDHCYPPDPGYGYVGVSRFRTRDGCYLYGRIRETDFIPVGSTAETARMSRGRLSELTWTSWRMGRHPRTSLAAMYFLMVRRLPIRIRTGRMRTMSTLGRVHGAMSSVTQSLKGFQLFKRVWRARVSRLWEGIGSY